jgi:hypothetical protein
MTATVHPPSISSLKKSRVLRLIPTIDKPLTTNCMDVTVKLKRALHAAKSGAVAGAIIVLLDHEGGWSVDLVGQLVHDDNTLFLITSRMFGACLASK